MEKGGLVLSGFSDGSKRTEILEIPKHKFYFATQYHSEFSSRLGKPEKSFLAFIESASARRSLDSLPSITKRSLFFHIAAGE